MTSTQNVDALRMKSMFSSFLHHLSNRLMASIAEDLDVVGENAAYSSNVCVD